MKTENKTASSLTYDERQRQITNEGWTLEHDDLHENGELAIAALCYEQEPYQRDLIGGDIDLKTELPLNWPWDADCWKPTPNDRTKELIKAGALYRAEIERIFRRLENIHKEIANLKAINP